MSTNNTHDKYKRFIHDLVELTGTLHNVQVSQVSNDLIYEIENDCVNWTSVSKVFTQDKFHSVIDMAKIMYKTFVSNHLSNIMRWRDDVNKYQTIYVDLQDVPLEHRRDIIVDLPHCLYSYGDECSMTVYKNDNVRIRIKYANDKHLISDNNKLFIKVSITPADDILSQNVAYMVSIRIEDTNCQMSIYDIRPLDQTLHISNDWFSNVKLCAYIDKMEKDKPDIVKIDTEDSEETEHITTVFDDAYYNKFVKIQQRD